jgi:hypothetical protein
MLILDDEGQAGSGNFQGLFFRETHYLSELRLEIEGEKPFLSPITNAALNEITVAYIYPQVQPERTGAEAPWATLSNLS